MAAVPMSKGRQLSIISRDYLPDSEPTPFPPELALLIVRKAHQMAAQFESAALDTMTATARRALRSGACLRQIAREMELEPRPKLRRSPEYRKP